MSKFHFEKLRQIDMWYSDVLVETDAAGIIESIHYQSSDPDAVKIAGVTIPGIPNAHSHAFQYAMIGMAEIHQKVGQSDDFWSWRNAMYQLALSVDPDQVEAIASMLYSEMLRYGYTHVAEFHYLHHDQDGQSYSNQAEMGERLARAAEQSGIGLTLVPIFYQKGGFGKDPLETQRRFISEDLESYLRLLEQSRKLTHKYPDLKVAFGVHSLRGVEPSLLPELVRSVDVNAPFHLHISEQKREVEDCLSYLGKRPVEYLSEQIEMNERIHLVHATHLADHEIELIARSGADVILCPTTEGNLGDGFFLLNKFIELGGNWSIGSDSHIGLNPFEEFRLLDYGQRMRSHSRLTFAGESGNSGEYALNIAVMSGRRAAGITSHNYFEVGQKLEAVTFSEAHPLFRSSADELLLSTILYTADASLIDTVIANGRVIVADSVHVRQDSISSKFSAQMKRLGFRL